MAGEYIPLAVSPTDGEQQEELLRENTYKSRSKRRRIALDRRVAIATTAGIVLALLVAWILFRPGPSSASEHRKENPYFWTGEIWDHNDQVSARLDRCAALGLLRNTSLPLPPLPAEEEQALIRQGCGTNETTIVILASLWTSEAFSGANPTGEVIYAQSVLQTLNANNYAYMFSNLGWWNFDMYKTMEIWKRHRWNVRFVLLDPEQANRCWSNGACLKTDQFLEGIEAWRLLSFWYWDDPGNPLGREFTLSPFIRNDNFHLSLSIEPTCKNIPSIPPDQRPRVKHAYLLAKQMNYFVDEPAFSWTIPGLSAIQRSLGIEIVGGITDDRPEVGRYFKDNGLTNLGRLQKADFYHQLAMSSVLIGVGRPRISPSPWDALCMGVPSKYINPILEWDEKDPQNRTSWHTQQWHMTDMQPPYVYHVHAHDLEELEETIKTVIATPIDSYIPDYMTFDHVRRVMAEVVEGDWRSKAEVILHDRIASGKGDLFVL